MDRFGPENFSTLQIKGHVLHRARAHLKAPPSVHKAHTTHNSSIRSDEGLALETSASLYGG